MEFENQLRMDKEMGQCYPENEKIKEAGKMMKEVKTKREAQTAVDS